MATLAYVERVDIAFARVVIIRKVFACMDHAYTYVMSIVDIRSAGWH